MYARPKKVHHFPLQRHQILKSSIAQIYALNFKSSLPNCEIGNQKNPGYQITVHHPKPFMILNDRDRTSTEGILRTIEKTPKPG